MRQYYFCSVKCFILISVFLVKLQIAISTENSDELGKIIFANVLFRHGDRTIIDPYPNDPYRNESCWPVPFGQLSNLGKHQHLMLGKWLRNRYSSLLPKKYSLYDIYIRSTDVDRTLMSAEANLAGLYPPFGKETWDISSWIPIPVHTTPERDDSLLAGKRYCDKYNYELERVKNSPEIKAIDEENANLYSYLTEKSGKKISSLESLEFLYNTFFIETLYNKTLPEWTELVYPDKMKPLAEKSFTLQAYNKPLQRLKSGPLLKEMIHNMLKKSKNSLRPDRKLWIYSGHDETIANFLMTLDLFEAHCPPYAATVLLELRVNDNGQYVVTIFYKNSTSEANLMTIPGCNSACPLNQFIRLTRDVIPKNWERECLMGFAPYSYQVDVNTTAVIALLTSSILILVVLMTILTFGYWDFKREYFRYYLKLSNDDA